MTKQPESASDFEIWLKSSIRFLDASSEHLDPDEGIFRDAAELVAQARLAALSLGARELAGHCRRNVSMLPPRDAAAILRGCLKWCRDNNPSQMLTINEVAAMLRIDARSVRRRAADGTLPEPVRIGRAVRWRRLDIELISTST